MNTFSEYAIDFFEKFFLSSINLIFNDEEHECDPLNLIYNDKPIDDANIDTAFANFRQADTDKTIMVSVLTKQADSQDQIIAFGQTIINTFFTPAWHLYLLKTKINNLTLYNLIIMNTELSYFVRPGLSIAWMLTKLIHCNIYYENEFGKLWHYDPKYRDAYDELLKQLGSINYVLEPKDHQELFKAQIINLADPADKEIALAVFDKAYQQTILDLKKQTASTIKSFADTSSSSSNRLTAESIYLLDLNMIFKTLKPHEEFVNDKNSSYVQQMLLALKDKLNQKKILN